MEDKKYMDKVILELRRECEKRQKPEALSDVSGLRKIAIYENAAYMMIPETWQSMSPVWRCAKYNRSDRPEIIMTDARGDATITFSSVGEVDEGIEIGQQLAQLKDDMRQVWSQIVFYGRGTIKAGEKDVEWMDCKTFCIDSELYSLLFLFCVRGQLILGNFHCSFSIYDKWKPKILELMGTIEEVMADE